MRKAVEETEAYREEIEHKEKTPEEKEILERDEDVSSDVGEHWHTSTRKGNNDSADDWSYINSGFDKDVKQFADPSRPSSDIVGDIQHALATWRICLSDNRVLDDLLSKSQDAPTATAYGDLMRRIDDFDKESHGWTVEHQDMRQTLRRLKGAATRMNETMLKTASECYSDIDEHTSYLDLVTISQDPVGYKLKRAIRRQNKRIFERLESYDDEIRGEKDMRGVLAAFLPAGQGDAWTSQEKARCESFISDYASKDAWLRKPHLERITNHMMDLAISIEMYTQDYLKDNIDKVAYFMTQLAYFEDIRNDPVNAEYFKRLPEKKQKKLDIINRIGTSFTPGDFVKNVNQVMYRPDTYKLDGQDEIRLSSIMKQGAVDEVATNFMYDTKLEIDSYKKDRRNA